MPGLFGGSPYPVDPQAQQGLMRDAWRQFSLAGLISTLQGGNVGQGLAAALASGRQAYAGGAEQAYNVGRQQEQDAQYKQYRDAQVQAQEALAEQRRQDAETASRGTEDAAQNIAAALAEIDSLSVSDEKKAAMRFLVKFGMGKPTESMLLPEQAEEPAVMTPYQQAQVGLSRERLDFQRQQAGRPAGGAEPGGPTPGQILTQVGQLVRSGMSPEDAAAAVQRSVDAMTLQGGISAVVPPPVPGGGGGLGARSTTPPDRAEQPGTGLESVESIVRANPRLAQGVQTMIDRGATPEEILEKLESMGYRGQ